LLKENKEKSVFLDLNLLPKLKEVKLNFDFFLFENVQNKVNSEIEKLRSSKLISKNSEAKVELNLSKKYQLFNTLT
jgi:hypothetical protein